MKRERPHPLLLAAGGLAVLVGLYLWVVVPVTDGLDARKRRLVEAGRGLEEAKRLAGQLATLGQAPAAAPVPEGFSLFSLVEGVASREGVKGNVEFMRPASRDLGGGGGGGGGGPAAPGPPEWRKGVKGVIAWTGRLVGC